MPKYIQGKIYTIVNSVNNTVYVGSTTLKLLCSRMGGHRSDSKSDQRCSPLYVAMRTVGVEHFRIVLHHLFPCTSKDELEAEEYKVLNSIIAGGVSVYNDTINGKRSQLAVAKQAAKITGIQNGKFTYGSLNFDARHSAWRFQAYIKGRLVVKSFSIGRHGNYGAHWRAEQARKQVYPEWGTEEDCTCDDFGEIEWD